MANGNCYTCGVKLSKDNATPSVTERGRGQCKKCSAEYRADPIVGLKAQRARSPKEFILYRVRGNAKVRGIECSLDVSDIPDIPEFCPVLPWVRIQYRIGNGKCRKDYRDAPSLDRINNDVGYVKGNVRIISFRANSIKTDATDEELVALGKDAASRQR